MILPDLDEILADLGQMFERSGAKHVPNVPNKVMFRTMFRTFLGMLRTCGQDQHAQAQHWLRQAQLMHAQHWPQIQMRTRQGGQPPLALFAFGSEANAEHA